MNIYRKTTSKKNLMKFIENAINQGDINSIRFSGYSSGYKLLKLAHITRNNNTGYPDAPFENFYDIVNSHNIEVRDDAASDLVAILDGNKIERYSGKIQTGVVDVLKKYIRPNRIKELLK